MMPFVQGLRENRTEECTPYVVGVHVEWGVVEGRREKRWQRASVGGGTLIHVNSHHIGSTLFNPTATLSVATTTICSLSMAS